MTHDTHDPDAALDRLLAGTLAREATESAGACLDAQTLAAWADDGLNAGDRAAAEAHAADCGRCQAMLAAMVKSAPATPGAAASPWRLPSLRWLIPLTAAAAAAIVWTVVPLRQTGPATVRQVSQSAESVEAPASATVPQEADRLSAPRTASSSARGDQETPRQDKELEADRKNARSLDANAESDAPARSADARLEKAQAASETATAAPAAAPPAAAAKAFSFGAPETVIVSSNPASRWRILPGGAVQRSADGGATWQAQSTGVSETLSAGASPSPSVCWLVGPGGIVLLSTDGRAWTRLAFPEAVQLVAVHATDDLTATVTTADGREFITEDGGQTWSRVPRI